MRTNALSQQVNFIIAVLCMGSPALLAIVLILEVAEMENPIASLKASRMEYQDL